VAPLPIEAKLAADPWIAQAVLCGEGRKYITALLSLRRSVVEAWAAQQGVSHDYAQLLAHHEVRARIQAAIDSVNADLSATERIRHFHLLDRELSLESGELTPTLKVRRTIVLERFHEQLETLYAGGGA
jgi:long-chain acyl-CoA synthetase